MVSDENARDSKFPGPGKSGVPAVVRYFENLFARGSPK